MPSAREDLPDTVERSPDRAKRIFAEVLDDAHRRYDDEARAHRTAYAALKHSFERVGDHWEEKDRPGPSDPQSRQHGSQAWRHPKETYGGVDVEGNTKRELYERARRLDVLGRSRMSKKELARAIAVRQ